MNFRFGMVLEVATAAGSVLGGLTAQILAQATLQKLFGIVTGLVAAATVARSAVPGADPGPASRVLQGHEGSVSVAFAPAGSAEEAATALGAMGLHPAAPRSLGRQPALPVSIIVVVLTEMIGDSVGLGYYITVWSTRFTFANVYAAIVVIGICGFVLDQVLSLARRSLMPWEGAAAR